MDTRKEMAIRTGLRVIVICAMFCIGTVGAPFAQDAEKELGWFLTGDFSAVWIGGNSESSTFGVAGELRRVWPRSELKLKGGGTRTESSLKTRTAVGNSVNDFTVNETKVTEKTSELYFARGRYDYDVTKHFLVFGGVDWLRNTFAGIDSRLLVAAGAGNIWADNDDVRFKTDYSATYTFQSDVVDNPFTKTDFPGLRFGYDFWWNLTESTDFESDLTADFNLDNSDDIRVDFASALPVTISERLALKPTIALLWRNEPSLAELDLLAPGGGATGEKVLVPLEKLDTLFTLALVVKL